MKKYLLIVMAVFMATTLFGCEKKENETMDSVSESMISNSYTQSSMKESVTEVTVENVKNLIEALPSLEDVEAMSLDDKRTAYDQTQAAYEAYCELEEGERDLLSEEHEKIEELFGYFNTLVEPAE